jgi:hypothetical protein
VVGMPDDATGMAAGIKVALLSAVVMGASGSGVNMLPGENKGNSRIPTSTRCNFHQIRTFKATHAQACLKDLDELVRRIAHSIAEVRNKPTNLLDIILSIEILDMPRILTSRVVDGPRYKSTGSATLLQN